MEPSLGGGASAIADLAARKWYAVMGIVGLVLFAVSWVVQIPTDPVIPRCIALMMMGWGFGQAECRTYSQHISGQFKITTPAWKWSVSGVLLFAISIGAAIWLVLHLEGIGQF